MIISQSLDDFLFKANVTLKPGQTDAGRRSIARGEVPASLLGATGGIAAAHAIVPRQDA
jgi:hypothetical protein